MAIEKKNTDAKKAPAKQKKPRKSPVVYFKEVWAELKKVSWPTKKELTSYSVVVTVFIVIVSLILFGMDTLFGKLLELVLKI
jgi:preprotein translocase subunit SecE